jgi:di/tricarboxylate transporter
MRLRTGDLLLLQGARDAIGRLGGNRDLWGLSTVAPLYVSRRKGAWTLGALGIAVLATTLGLAPMSVSFLLAALAVVLMRVVTAEDAYRLIEWRLIVLIAGMTAFGLAMQKTGAAAYLAGFIIDATLPLGMTATLTALALLTVLLTQPMSNAAAALVVLPVAVATAAALGVNPRSFAVLVTLSASLSFITPLEPASLLVYAPGKYRFSDFVRVGLPLTLLTVAILVAMTPLLWPL